MKKAIPYAIVQIHPNESLIFETEDQERKLKEKFTNDLKLKLAGYEIDIRFAIRVEK